MPLAQSADSEQAAWRKRIAIRPLETAQGRKQWRKQGKGARKPRRKTAQAKPSQARRTQGRKAQAGRTKKATPFTAWPLLACLLYATRKVRK